jgi:hypothetical protein
MLGTQTIWDQGIEALKEIDAISLAQEHLQSCNHCLQGYWHQDQFYRTLVLPKSTVIQLTSQTFLVTMETHHTYKRIKLEFVLKPDPRDWQDLEEPDDLGELSLIYDEDLNFVDENWMIDLDSPFVRIEN